MRAHRLADGSWQPLEPHLITEGLYHEGVHAFKHQSVSIEEEFDAYAASLCAGAAAAGKELPDLLTLDGKPAAVFVREHYPDLPAKPDYEPVGETIEWPRRRTGMK